MSKNQLNIFNTKRIEFNEQIELTCKSVNAYADRHDHWVVAWSMGKDSTTLVTLLVELMESGQIKRPKSFTVFCADTRMEILPLWYAAHGVIKKLREKGIEVRIVTAELDKRFLVYMLGRGVPPPSNTFRWCTGHIKVEPMENALKEFHARIGEKILMLTGVRQGESAIRDGRIAMSCSKDGAECGQGWYQEGLASDMCSTLAPILHWRVCSIWDWLKVFAPSKQYGEWSTAILADAYGGDEAEEINARTGCCGCPLVEKDKGLNAVIRLPEWNYLSPLLELKVLYRQMKKPQYRHRQPGGKTNKDGSLAKNQQRLGAITLEARKMFLEKFIDIQNRVNAKAELLGRPKVDFLNDEEIARIKELISLKTFPQGWTGEEPTGDIMLDKVYSDGSVAPILFRDMINRK